MTITTAEIKEKLNLKTNVEVARLLGTTRQHVYSWGDRPIPKAHQWKLRAMLPGKFPMSEVGS